MVGWHFFRFQKAVRIADEIREPARLEPGQPADEMQQRRAFGQIERRAEPDVVAADIQTQRNLARHRVRDELIQQMARGQRDLVELRRIPCMKQNEPVGRALDDRVETLTQLIDRLVQQHLFAPVLDEARHDLEAAIGRIGDLIVRAGVDELVRGPFAPLHAVDVAEIVRALAVRILEPLRIFVRVRVPDLAAERAEIRRALRRPQKAHQLADRGFERELLRGHGRKALLQVETQHRAGHADRADARAVFLPSAGIENRLDELEILFHSMFPGCAACPRERRA